MAIKIHPLIIIIIIIIHIFILFLVFLGCNKKYFSFIFIIVFQQRYNHMVIKITRPYNNIMHFLFYLFIGLICGLSHTLNCHIKKLYTSYRKIPINTHMINININLKHIHTYTYRQGEFINIAYFIHNGNSHTHIFITIFHPLSDA